MPGGGQVGSSGPCQDDQFGVNALNSNSGFIDKIYTAPSTLSKAISNIVRTIIDELELDKHLNTSHEIPEIQASGYYIVRSLLKSAVYPQCYLLRPIMAIYHRYRNCCGDLRLPADSYYLIYRSTRVRLQKPF